MDADNGLRRWADGENVVLLAFLALLAWAPLPYGSNRLWAELALGLGLGAVLAAWAGVALSGFAAVTPLNRRLATPALLMTLALGWGFVQALDLGWLSEIAKVDVAGLAHPVWSMTESALQAPTGAFVSVDPELTRQALFAAGMSVAAFMIAFELTRDRSRAGTVLAGVAVIAVLYAALAMASSYLDADFQSWLMPDPKRESGRVSGPFVNPNHFATYLAIAAIAALGIFVETFRQSVIWDRGWRLFARTGLQAMTGALAIWFAAIVALISTLLLTQSRGGVLAFLLGMLALIVALAVGEKRGMGEASGKRAMAALLVAVLGVATALTADPLFGRIEQQGIADAGRASLAQSALDAVQSAPLVGHGFGAFRRYYPFFADGTVEGDVDEVHNDILEVLADLGLPAGLAYMAAPALLAGMCFSGCLRRRRDRLYPAVGFAASIVVGVHAFVDFSLQIPAIAVTYAALLGTGVAQSWRTNMDMVR